MSTNGALSIFKALVHGVRPDGKVLVRVPALSGNPIIIDPPPNGASVPPAGTIISIGVTHDRAQFFWITFPFDPSDLEAAHAAHLADTSDAHDASAISYAGGTGISATDVEGALDEINGDVIAHIDDTVDAHDASAISYAGGTNMSATTVESAIDELANEKAMFTQGSYTPTLGGMAVGSDGTNTAEYTFIGGPSTGDYGLMTIDHSIVFGTTGNGASYPAATNLHGDLPSGFEFDTTAMSTLTPVGEHTMSIAGTNSEGRCWYVDANTYRFIVSGSASSYVNSAATTSVIPGTWAANSAIRARIHSIRVVRV